MLFGLRRASGATFVHPLDPAPRTAVLAAGFQPSRSIRIFPKGWDKSAEKFAPAVIAGTFDRLIALAGRVQITHAVICLAFDPRELLSDAARHKLWVEFGVPVYEQLLGPGNELIAYECDAHRGLHLAGAPDDGRDVCPCGSGVPMFGRVKAAAA